jgi:hypothetical protein
MYLEVMGMALSRRVEVLFGEGEYEALRREAARRRVTVGELVREAVRRAYLRPSEEERRAAISRICSREVDVGTWEDVKPLIGRFVEERSGAEG